MPETGVMQARLLADFRRSAQSGLCREGVGRCQRDIRGLESRRRKSRSTAKHEKPEFTLASLEEFLLGDRGYVMTARPGRIKADVAIAS